MRFRLDASFPILARRNYRRSNTPSFGHFEREMEVNSRIPSSSRTADSDGQFYEILNSNGVSTKLNRLHDAARFLFTAGTGAVPSSVSTGKQGFRGPIFQSIMALRCGSLYGTRLIHYLGITCQEFGGICYCHGLGLRFTYYFV